MKHRLCRQNFYSFSLRS